MKTRNLLAIVSAMVMIIVGRAQAADLYWSGNGTSLGGAGTWNTASSTNWGSAMAGPFVITWVNGNNDIARFGSTAGAVALGATIDVGGLWFDTTAYTLTTTGFTLNFAATDNAITLNNIAAATITGPVGGSGNVTLTAANPGTAGTINFSGTSAGGWSGTTTVNPSIRLELTGNANNQALLSTTNITLNGGTIAMGSATTAIGGSQATLNRINDTAPVTVNGGGTIAYDVNNSSANSETVGTLNLVMGQFNLTEAFALSSGSSTFIFSGLTRTGSGNTSALNLQAKNTAFSSGGFQRVVVGGVGANTPAGEIVGPWFTTLYANNASADYIVYTNGGSGSTYYAVPAAATLTAPGESGWSSGTTAYQFAAATTLSDTRSAAALRYTGAAASLGLGASIFNLETYGILNGGSGLLTISTTGTGGLTTPSTGSGTTNNLFLTTAVNAITVSAPIKDNTSSVTLVKSGGNTLTLSGTSTYSGGTVLNAGTLTYTADSNLGASGSRNIAVDGAVTLNAFSGSSLGTLTVNKGATATIPSVNLTFTSATGSGTIQYGNGGAANVALTIGDASAFTGTLQSLIGYNGGQKIQFTKLSDAVGSGNLVFGGSSSDWAQSGYISLYGNAGPLTLNNRYIEILQRPSGNHGIYQSILENNNSSDVNKWVINTPLLYHQNYARILTLGGTNLGDNEFAGLISNGDNGGTLNLTKAGSGKWILSGNNTYSGGTTISAGTLIANVDNALGRGNVTVTAGKLIGVVGGSCSNSAITVSGGMFGISVTDTSTNWICKALTHSAAATLEFAFGGNTPSTNVAPLQVNGDIVFSAAPTVSCTNTSLSAGTYPLITWTGAFSGVVPSTLTLPSGVTGLLVIDHATKTLWLSISASGGSKQPLTWKGPAGSIWVANGSVYTNWQDATTPTPVNTNYQETTVNSITVGDNVVFGPTGAGTVTLNTTVSPASMSINTTANYMFSGTGSIAGPGGLTKANSGTLTLSTTNSYSGGTLLSAGILSIAADNALGTGWITLNGGTLQSSDATARTLANPVVLNGSTAIGGTGNLNFTTGAGLVMANSTLTVTNNLNATFGTSFGGAFTLTKAGVGTLTLTGTNTYSGATTVSKGTLVVSGGQITNNAAVTLSGSSTMTVTNANLWSGALTVGGSSANNNTVAVYTNSVWTLPGANIFCGYAASGNALTIDGGSVNNAGGVIGIGVAGYISSTPWNWNVGSGNYNNNSLTVRNGGRIYSGDVIVGLHNGTGGSTYNVGGFGAASVVSNGMVLLGEASSNNRLNVTNATLQASSLYVAYSTGGNGFNPDSSGNAVSVYNQGTIQVVGAGGIYVGCSGNNGVTRANILAIYKGGSVSAGGVLNVGAGPSTTAAHDDQVLVTDGGQLITAGATIGQYGTNNSVQVVGGSGGTSIWNCSGSSVTVGSGKDLNQLVIGTDGVLTNAGLITVGTGAGSFNTVTVTNGAVWSGGLTVGNASSNNAVTLWNGATWYMLGSNVTVGVGAATGNVFTVNAGGVVTNTGSLTVRVTNKLSLGAGGQIYAGAVTNAGTLAVGLDKNVTPACGRLAVNGNLNLNNARLDVSIIGTPTEPCVIATYGTLIPPGVFAATNGLSDKYRLEMNYKGLNQIAIVYSAAGTIIRLK